MSLKEKAAFIFVWTSKKEASNFAFQEQPLVEPKLLGTSCSLVRAQAWLLRQWKIPVLILHPEC